jgi:hypothetical protein
MKSSALCPLYQSKTYLQIFPVLNSPVPESSAGLSLSMRGCV